MVVAAAATCAASLLGAVAALTAACASVRWRSVLLTLTIASFALPPFLTTNTWLYYLGLNGVWRPYLNFDIYSLTGLIYVLGLQLWPITFLLTLAPLLRLDRAYLEQETLLRNGGLVRHLLWPLARGGIWQGAFLVFVLALNSFSAPTLLQQKVYSEEVWLAFNTRFDYTEAFRLSWPLVAAPLVLLLAFRGREIPFRWQASDPSGALLRRRFHPAILIGLRFTVAVLLGASLVLPLGQLLSSGRAWQEFWPAASAARNSIGNSFLFAASTAAIVMLAGLFVRRSRWPVATWLIYLAPGMVLAMLLILALNRPWLSFVYPGVGVVLLGYGLRFLPLGWSAARWAHRMLDQALLDAGRVFGGSAFSVFRIAEWPRVALGVGAAAYLTYLFALWDVETLIFLVPPGRETLALRIFNMLHYGHVSQVDALCLWLLLLALAPLVLWLVMRKARGVWMLALPLLASCSVQPSNQAPVRSEIFSSVQIIGSRGTGAGQFNKPRSMALDREDNLYVVDMTGRVQKFSPDGQFLLLWQMPETDKGKPKGMALDQAGNIIVVEPHYSRVNHYTPEGKLAFNWGVNGTNGGELYFPRSVAVDAHGELFISEYGKVERLQHFSADGHQFLGVIGGPGVAAGEFSRAEGIGIGPNSQIFVADSCNHRVQIFDANGKFSGQFGQAGTSSGDLSYPYDVRVDPNGLIYVCEFGNSRVQVFSPDLKPLEILGGAGLEPGMMNNPWSIAFNSKGDLYVADAANHRVQKFVRRKPLAS